jgi:hypothetical protein
MDTFRIINFSCCDMLCFLQILEKNYSTDYSWDCVWVYICCVSSVNDFITDIKKVGPKQETSQTEYGL